MNEDLKIIFTVVLLMIVIGLCIAFAVTRVDCNAIDKGYMISTDRDGHKLYTPPSQPFIQPEVKSNEK